MCWRRDLFFWKGRSGSVYKKHRYHPYERDKGQSWGFTSRSTARVILGQVLRIATRSDNRRQERPAWKNLSRGHHKKCKGKQQFSSRPAKGQQSYKWQLLSFSKLQPRLLAGNSSPLTRQTMNTQLKVNVDCHFVTDVYAAPGLSQRKDVSPGVADCHLKNCKLKFVKSVSCVTQLSCVKPVSNVTNAVQNLPVGARLQTFWKTWLDLGAGPKVVQILKEGYTLPFQIRPKLTRSPTVISCYVNPHRNSYLLEALHQLIDKNAVELVHSQTSLVPKPNNKWRPILDLSKLNQLLKVEKFKMETPETIRTSLQQGEWVTSVDIKDAYFHIPYRNSPENISGFMSRVGHTNSVWSVHSSNGVYCTSKGGETDGYVQGYKNPPVPRRLVGEVFNIPKYW